MAARSYVTIFEIGFGSFPWGTVCNPLIFIAVSFFLIGVSRFSKLSARRRTAYMGSGVVIGSLALFFFVLLLTAKGSDFLKFRNQYVSGKSQVLEGVVTSFRPAPTAGPADESFTVNGKVFSYNVLDADICFHDAPLHRGPLRDGLDVRIYYYADCIQRVDLIK